MTPGTLAGGLRVAARWHDGVLSDWQIQLVRPPLAQTLVGLAPAEALARVPLYFSLCGLVQRETGRMALAAAGYPVGESVPAWLLWAEATHELLWRLLLDWPRLFGEPARSARFAAWRATRARGRVALAEATATLAAELAGEGALRADLAGPLDALAVAARALADDSVYPCSSAGVFAEGRGEAWSHTARGPLRHALRVEDGRVAAWRVDAPTDRKFADERGIVENLPACLPTPDAARQAVERAVLRLDPCVPYLVEIVDA